jgi:hypothetical protein
VRQIAVPGNARAISTLSRIDYQDAFLVKLALLAHVPAVQTVVVRASRRIRPRKGEK